MTNMTVLKPQVLIAGISVLQEPRRTALSNGVILAHVGEMGRWTKRWKNGFYIKNVPDTAIMPHKGQMEIRAFFGYLAHNAPQNYRKGIINDLPPVAAYIQKAMKGARAMDSYEPSQYPSRIHRTYHTAEQLAQKLGVSLAQASSLLKVQPTPQSK